MKVEAGQAGDISYSIGQGKTGENPNKANVLTLQKKKPVGTAVSDTENLNTVTVADTDYANVYIGGLDKLYTEVTVYDTDLYTSGKALKTYTDALKDDSPTGDKTITIAVNGGGPVENTKHGLKVKSGDTVTLTAKLASGGLDATAKGVIVELESGQTFTFVNSGSDTATDDLVVTEDTTLKIKSVTVIEVPTKDTLIESVTLRDVTGDGKMDNKYEMVVTLKSGVTLKTPDTAPNLTCASSGLSSPSGTVSGRKITYKFTVSSYTSEENVNFGVGAIVVENGMSNGTAITITIPANTELANHKGQTIELTVA